MEQCNTSFYSVDELSALGLKSIGDRVLISRKCSIYSPHLISIGSNVRIDDFCILSGEITIGDNIHISAYCALYGALGIELRDNSGLSARVTIYSAMDDFSGNYLIGPMHDSRKTNVSGGKVIIEEFTQVGVNAVVFPNLTVGIGSVVGALSLVNKSLEPWGIYVGIPVRKIRVREKRLLDLL